MTTQQQSNTLADRGPGTSMSDHPPAGWHTYDTASKRVRRSRRTIRHWKHQGLPTKLDEHGRRIIKEEHLLKWWRERMTNDPVHKQRVKKLLEVAD